ncbi:MAG: hypothetical protein ACLP7A_03250 [Desulfobaccales bacterium]
MTRIFITATITARGEVGIEESRAQEPVAPGIIPKEALPRAIILRAPLRGIIPKELPGIVLKGVPVPFRGIVPREALILDIVPREVALPGIIPRRVALRDIILREAHLLNISLPLPALLNPGRLLLMRNIISRNSPAAARSQIAPPGAIWAFLES